MRTRLTTPYLFLLPSLLILSIFIYYPVVQNLYSGFYSWSPFSDTKEFLGWSNYTSLLSDPVFFTALKNTFLHAGISIVVQVFGGLIIAAFLEDKIFRRFSPFLRTVYFIPALTSVSIVGLLFNFIYNPKAGLLNEFLTSIGLGEFATGWLGNSETAIYAVIAMSQWQGLGYITMLYIVAIQKIPNELYEASIIDGCNSIQKFFYVTLPQVREMMFVTVIYTLSQSIKTFADVFVLTSGGPGYSTQVLSTYLYQKAFVDNEMGFASAIANIIFLITLFFFLVQSKIFKTGKEE